MKEIIVFLESQGFFLDFKSYIEPDCKIAKGEKVIGEMNILEKGLFSFIYKKEESQNELTEKIRIFEEVGDYEILEKLELEILHNGCVIELANKIMWTSINLRFQTSQESTGTGIRKGFKVVEVYDEEKSIEDRVIVHNLGIISLN